MAKYTAGSYTKNFSWQKSYKRLHAAVAKGFSGGLQPISRDDWRKRSGIKDHNRQLIPMNFFLHSLPGIEDDFIVVDRLVEIAVGQPYNSQFAQLALFAFHIANSGTWKHSKWPNGQVAGWANELIRDAAAQNGKWSDSAFEELSLKNFIERRIEGEPVTKRKVLTNYRYMLESADVLVDGKLQPANLRQRWIVDAVQLFWDRQILSGALPAGAGARALEDSFFNHEINKLLRCDKAQGQAFVRAALREYLPTRRAQRVAQVEQLKDAGLIAA